MNPINICDGDRQEFGTNGITPKGINISGNVSTELPYSKLCYTLNAGKKLPTPLGPDGNRLDQYGDFNVKIAWDELNQGTNLLTLHLSIYNKTIARKEVELIKTTPCVPLETYESDLPMNSSRRVWTNSFKF